MSVRRGMLLLGLIMFCFAMAACRSKESDLRKEATAPPAAPAPQPPRSTSVTPAEVGYTGELPPLPVSSFPAARPIEIVTAAYTFAARRPDVLRYVPCFCGCERNGHQHNEDCFVADRDATGKPRWEPHGMS